MYRLALQKYFNKQSNVDYVIDKTNGPDQASKIYEFMCYIDGGGKHDKEAKLLRLKTAVKMLNEDKLLWSHSTFEVEKKKIEEENDFTTCPYEISEGVLVCRKCDSRKIYSFSKQTRSMDEPTTIFAKCSECDNKWCEGS
jgi:DNA-directed RNA polymerase subunit M/transcription elongation factor TFIIS